MLAENSGLREGAEQKLLEKINLLRRIYAQGDMVKAFPVGEHMALENWHARLIWERDDYADKLKRLNSNLLVRLLRRFGLLRGGI